MININKLEILVRTWDKNTLLAGVKREQQNISDLKHEWMGTSAQLKQLCKFQKRCDVLIAELASR